jgi:hypothetical protein
LLKTIIVPFDFAVAIKLGFLSFIKEFRFKIEPPSIVSIISALSKGSSPFTSKD